MGDSGKEGNVRRWGAYDDYNGIFFELSGSVLHAVVRSDVTGEVLERKIPQSEWNLDKFDGTGVSNYNLDVTKVNLYSIDYAWLGVGVIRIGVALPDGTRRFGHYIENSGNLILPWARRAMFPIAMDNTNIGTAVASSEMRHICTAVYAQSRVDYTYWRFGDVESNGKIVTNNTPLLSVRSKQYYGNVVNRLNAYPEEVTILTQGGPCKLQLAFDSDLTGSVFGEASDGMLEYDISATSCSYGEDAYIMRSWIVPEGVTRISLEEYFESTDEGILLSWDGITQPHMTISATKLTGSPVTASVVFNYKELR
jgi:hypothetical protein